MSRPFGSLNKNTAEVKKLAGEYTAEAITILIDLARTAKSETARIAAVKELLDRACGKAIQGVDLEATHAGKIALCWQATAEAAAANSDE